MLIKKLVECVSKGGNFLLNIGPDANGVIPPRAAETLDEIGRFMRANGQSIYGCTKSAIPKPEWGRITQKGNELYLHVYENTLGPLPLFGINAQSIDSIRQLSDGREIPLSHSWVHSDYPDMTFADLGPDPTLDDGTDTVLKLTLKE